MSTIVFLLLAIFSSTPETVHVIPTSEVVRIAKLTAADEGFRTSDRSMFFDELRTKDGQEPLTGYTSIALYKGGQILRSYSIRVDSGDIIDANECKIFQYPNLLAFRARVQHEFGTTSASIKRIASEAGCDQLTVIH